jgi:hypothetical protein
MSASTNRAVWCRYLFCWALAAVIVLLGAASAYAQGLVQYQFTGVVTDNSGNLGVLGPFNTLQVNDTFSGRFSYMTGPTNPDQEPGDPTLGAYNLIDFVVDQGVVPITPFAVGIRHVPPTPTLPPLPPDLGTDAFIVAGRFMSGMDTKSISLRLEAPFEDVFSNDSLPSMVTLGDFTDVQIVQAIRVIGLPPSGTSQIDAGQITSLVQVPEPSGVALALLGAVLLLLHCRKHTAFA